MKEAEMYIINPIKNRLPGGRFFKNIISDAKILYKNPNKINLCVFASSLKAYFIIFDKKKIKIFRVFYIMPHTKKIMTA